MLDRPDPTMNQAFTDIIRDSVDTTVALSTESTSTPTYRRKARRDQLPARRTP
jgi:hypothetical protein